ncbi:hypothetical protein [Paenibacillus sp. 1001270B_150601_E10]|uniref:hypothetical protein n=1 Tax=Paenibacillus sp. 1001270B_150601_E10 TaxID=2787079 RepID=UPI00189FB726|nr:hypothetical protein [Paenibacillus sp. 1001270B_150601_E10]
MRTFKTFDQMNKVTQNYLQFCYMCDDKAKCTTEAACRECWTKNNCDAEVERHETRDMLQAYYA